jgi:lipoyl(octanoyl) transferase
MTPDWRVSDRLVPYETALSEMERRVDAIRADGAPELVWLLEHPPLYTAGTSARAEDLLDAGGLPVYATGRGGQYTYHGPGQRIGYVMLDLKARGGTEAKIAALGIRVRRWVTFHGVALNVDPDLARFGGIVPCGIRQHGVTSLADQGVLVSMPEVDAALKAGFEEVFGGEQTWRAVS